jgi:hypothetical protein
VVQFCIDYKLTPEQCQQVIKESRGDEVRAWGMAQELTGVRNPLDPTEWQKKMESIVSNTQPLKDQ